MLNKVGDNTSPCGNPSEVNFVIVLFSETISIVWLFRNAAIHLITSNDIWFSFRIFINFSASTLLYPFDKSTYMTPARVLFRLSLFISFTKSFASLPFLRLHSH